DIGALVRTDWRVRVEPVMPREKTDTRSVALVVDDSITVRRVTQRLLERNGMRVLTARDGVDAMEMLQEHTPDIILLDIEMPRMDGYEVATQVRADARLSGIPIIMITSRVGEKHRARAIEKRTCAKPTRGAHGRTHIGNLQPAGAAARRSPDHPAFLRGRGGGLPG